ncbi:MAG: holo-ACP synthase [Aristaeellaceae bacterium]
MCKGLGLDLCAVSRMEPLLADDRFLTRCFTGEEAAYIRSRGAVAAQSMAGIWAAKEALLKATGRGLSLPLREIEVCHDPAGQPGYRLHGSAAQALSGTFLLSITHEGDMAAAVCLWMVE